MIEFLCDPPLDKKSPQGAFAQTVTMLQDGKTIGIARWHSPADERPGIMQLLDLSILKSTQRKGHGKQLLKAAIEQARELHRQRKSSLRRVWISIEQKSQIVGRAFLSANGFQHIATMNGLYPDQDLMIYVKSLD